MTYAEATEYLYGLRRFGWRPGLDTTRHLLALVGSPQDAFPSVHIGGTNGKGSTAALVSAILRAGGYRTGLYTSPHLASFTERIQVDGEPIGEAEIAALTERLQAVCRGEFAPETVPPAGDRLPHPTFFELTTAMAFLHFVRRAVGAAVIEVGLGGRLDATNVLAPTGVAITNVALEHEAYLGSTVAEIAAEKAGILKPGVPAVTTAGGEALEAIRRAAAGAGAPLVCVPEVYTWRVRESGLDGQRFDLAGPAGEYRNLWIPLAGRHQIENAALAVALAEGLAAAGFRLGPDAIRQGLAAACWPGRLQTIPGRPRLLLDGAHNPPAVLRLAVFLAEHREALGRIVLVFGVLDDKRWQDMLPVLAPLAAAVVVTRPPTGRAADPSLVAAAAGAHPRLQVVPEPAAALAAARTLAGPDDTILVTGSLYVVGTVLGLLDRSR